jgi:hypothetical protein
MYFLLIFPIEIGKMLLVTFAVSRIGSAAQIPDINAET